MTPLLEYLEQTLSEYPGIQSKCEAWAMQCDLGF